MGYNFIPLTIIVISLAIIIFIIGRKLSQLANIDLESIIQEREATIKDRIIINRLHRKLLELYNKIFFLFKPFLERIKVYLKKLYDKILEIEKIYRNINQVITPLKKIDLIGEIKKLLSEAEEFLQAENYIEAEKKYIEIIKLDNKNLEAYEGLAELYLQKKELKQAKQTFKYLLELIQEGKINQLSDDRKNSLLASYYSKLGFIYQLLDQNRYAFNNLKKAIELEPNNPKYLDQIVNISIMLRDKISALNFLDKLREVNPENQKLPELEEEIKGLE